MSTPNVAISENLSRTYHPGWRGVQQTLFMLQILIALGLLVLNIVGYTSTVAAYEQCMASLPEGNVISFCDQIYSTRWYPPQIAAFALVIVIGVVGLVYWTTRMRLTVSPDGLEYDSGTHRTRATWDHVTGLMRDNRVIVVHEYLTLRESEVEASPLFRWAVGEKERTLIPVSLFAWNWRNSPLGDEVRRFAPHVFDQAASG